MATEMTQRIAEERAKAAAKKTMAPIEVPLPEEITGKKESSFLDQLLGFAKSPAALAGLSNIAGGVGGYQYSKDEFKDAENALKDASRLAGTYVDPGQSQALGVQDDDRVKLARQQALESLIQKSTMGYSPEDEAFARTLQGKVNQDFASRQKQLDEGLQRRGVQLGSGLALAQQQANAQAALQQQSQSADQEIVNKANLRQKAIEAVADQSGAMLQQDSLRALNRANSIDTFNQRNADARMQAARSEANSLGDLSAMYATKGQRQANMISGIGSGIGTGITAYNQSTQNTGDDKSKQTQPQQPAAPQSVTLTPQIIKDNTIDQATNMVKQKSKELIGSAFGKLLKPT